MFAEGYISISGTIGVGKSTMAQELARAMDFEPIYEAVKENPYLDLFYGNMKKYGTMMQVWLLNHRLRQHQEFVYRIGMGRIKGVVQDRSIWEDTIFCRMLNQHPDKIISDLDYNTYLDLFDNMVLKGIVYPQLLIYLDCPPKTALERIKQRGRKSESAITIEYLKSLKDNYDIFINEMEVAGVKILRLDWEKFKPIEEIADLVHKTALKPSNFTKWIRPLRK